jgi:hypothetical protein
MASKKEEQRAFFISTDGAKLLTHTAKDFRKIKPKEKKEKKQKRATRTPFEEIVALERAVRQRAVILEQYGAAEDMNGDIYMMRKSQMSLVGAGEASEFMKELRINRPDLPEIPVLSPVALKLRYALMKQQQERGPLHAKPFSHANQFDAFGKPLK